MKHFFAVLLTFAFLLLTACSNKAPYEVTYDEKTFTVDPVNCTVTVDDHVCSYEIQEHAGSTRFEVTYPDGSLFWREDAQTHGTWGWSDDYRASRYVDGDILYEVLDVEVTPEHSGSFILPGLLLIAIGLFSAANPHASWYLSRGWHYKDAEPSDMALAANRVGGFIAIIAGIICFFI